MKLILILLITLEFSIINSSNQFSTKKISDKINVVNRKASDNSERPLMLVGFFNYSQTFYGNVQGPVKYALNFYVHFINETSIPFYTYLNMPISLKLTDYTNTMVDYNISCSYDGTYKEADELQALSYYCNLNNLNNFSYVKPKIHFIFNNGSTVINEFTEENIDKSYIADDTINNYQKHYKNDTNYDCDYDIFYLKDIKLKDNEFTLYGNFSQSYVGEQIFLSKSGIDYNNFTIKNDSIKFIANGTINEHLHGKISNTTNGTLFLFYAKSGLDDLLAYPISNEYVEVAGFRNYKAANENRDATSELIFTGTQYSLRELKYFVRFNVAIKYDNLRILQGSTQTITAIGMKTLNEEKDDYAIYNINYTNTAKKNIISMDIPKSLEFSDDNITYSKIDENIFIPSDLNLTNTENVTVERIEYLSFPDTSTSNSLSFDFNASKLNLRDDKTAYLSYYPFNKGDRKAVKCYIENKTLPYKMTCSPKQYIYTQMNTLKFIIPEIKSSSRRLRSLSTETNRTLYPPTNYSGIMEYEYNPGGNVFSRKTASNGLSAGAIVAIVLATVAAVACVALAFFFLNRVKVTPPPIKTPTDVNFANTSTNINH